LLIKRLQGFSFLWYNIGTTNSAFFILHSFAFIFFLP